MCKFFQCWFLKRHPWSTSALLNLWVPALTWQRFTCDCTRFARCWKENGRLSSTKSNCMALCFKKTKTSFASKGRYKVIPCTTLICTKAAAIQPAISYFKLFLKSLSLKRGIDASPWWTVVFQLNSNSWNMIYTHSPGPRARILESRTQNECRVNAPLFYSARQNSD